ncbi:MAG: serine/threonine-protein kinase [Bacteroidota bacterium]
MTDAERHARASALFHEALARPEAERAAWLAQASDDTALRRQVGTLLEAHAEADGLLDRPALPRLGGDGAEADPLLGQNVGPWRVTGLLGRGGMGSVYAAERADDTFDQHAALKLVRPGLGGGFRARFVRERALLAGLDHPGIARLLDGGVAPDGTPYLATERVDGEPITAYAARHRLGVEARVRLFLQACEAVAYAHRNLVVHRDLKPAHVLVSAGIGEEGLGVGEGTKGASAQSPTPNPQSPVVKLLDFGIATLLDADGELLTNTDAGPMTPAYAAPEQLLRRPVTTATDVYALGVVLYELLAGRRPYRLGDLTAAQVEHVVCEADPPRPSEANAELRGDLDAIVLKAMAKEPERRYTSAAALADDLRRHLDGRPVEARPATAGYRVGRFVRRHRLGVAAAAAVVALVALLTTVYTLRLGAERDRARTAATEAAAQAERAEAVAGFLEQILRAPNARWYVDAEAKGPETPIRAVLDEAARRVETEFDAQPALRADLHHVLGDTYTALGLYPEAGHHHRATLALRESLHTAPHPAIAEALYYAAPFLDPDDVLVELAAMERAAAMLRAEPGGNNAPFIVQEVADFYLLLGRPADARAAARDGWAFAEATFVPGHEGHRYRAAILESLALESARAALDLSDLADARRWIARLDSLRGETGVPSNPRRALVQGRMLLAERRYPEAEPLLLAAREDARPLRRGGREVLEDQTPAEAATALVALYDATGRPVLAEAQRQALAPYLASRDSLRHAAR